MTNNIFQQGLSERLNFGLDITSKMKFMLPSIFCVIALSACSPNEVIAQSSKVVPPTFSMSECSKTTSPDNITDAEIISEIKGGKAFIVCYGQKNQLTRVSAFQLVDGYVLQVSITGGEDLTNGIEAEILKVKDQETLVDSKVPVQTYQAQLETLKKEICDKISE